jgi:pimeloyl-ACP methyl ester carboxylesterase/ketosteroid isomerase-like protein
VSTVESGHVAPGLDLDTIGRFRVDCPVAGGTVAAELLIPEAVRSPATVLVCLPGGSMSSRYFDLEGGDAAGSFSLASYFAAAGFVVALIDHLGVGKSSIPDDPWQLTPAVIADANAGATDQIVTGLRTGGFGVPALPNVRPVAIAHSMGGLMAVTQQARHSQFRGLGLLGTSACGLREALTAEEIAALDAGDVSVATISRLAKQRYGQAIVPPPQADPAVSSPARKALSSARSNMLAVCALTSMMTGSMRAEFEAIDVPVFLGVGEFDIAGPSHRLPADFPNSNDISLFVLPAAGHNTIVARNRTALWSRLLGWVRRLVDDEGQQQRNIATVRGLLAAVSSQDFATFVAGMADDVVYEAPFFAGFGERRGRDSIAAMFGGMKERFSQLRYDVVADYPASDPNLVIVECRGDNVVIGSDQHYRNHYFMFVRFDDAGLVRHWREISNPDVYRREVSAES